MPAERPTNADGERQPITDAERDGWLSRAMIGALLGAMAVNSCYSATYLRRIASSQDALLCIRAMELGVAEATLPPLCRRNLQRPVSP